ncbi:hydroxyisourate hydrolase [Massilia sp. IC2-477]|uniref:hydroxyisourate hydrolase n=1 Tax=unclassified Massilia TaxID=2609279 RepID=UPI001D1037DD|nr:MULTISPECIES: hydroxyisourate hydrolase [unclassified Massilia]MCC2957893.1 hydroxyisourate hydrolase [Massilia sp. IC2-477]MCC2974054.1 hydroxyisourate hydrolase [Massilia sp. IC2-476]
MRLIRQLTLAALLGAASIAASAAPNPLSVHVLDLQSGQPTAGIRVTLEQREGAGWRELASGVTDAQGRIQALYPENGKLAAADYRIVFQTGEHYKRRGQATFFPRIPVEFTVDAPAQHYHIPLLLSPFGYSTYRGN